MTSRGGDGVQLLAPERALPRAWFWIGVLFLLALLPALASPGVYHGDERFYTDAALAMERTGELVPRYADGAPRLNKPLFAYAAIVASHELFGVGLLQSRLPFALAGALLVMLAGAAASRLLADERAGTLAALVLASNPDVLTLSSRSTPDILVCASVLLALDGASRVLLEDDERGRLGEDRAARPRGVWRFWIGAGLATAAKGLWGPLLVAFVLLGAWARPALRARARRLFRPLPIALGLALGAAGVLPLLAGGAQAVLDQGAEDQLRASLSLAVVARNLREYLPSLVIHLLPWTLLAALLLFTREGRGAARAALRTPFARAALAWWLVLVLVFVAGSARRVRYLSPALAPAAIALAGLLLAATRSERSARVLRAAGAFVAGLGALALLGCALLLARWRALVALELVVLASTCGACAWFLARRPSTAAPLAFGWSALALAFAFVGVLRPALAYSPLPEIAARIEREPAPLALLDLEDALAARLRLLTGGRVEPRRIETRAVEPAALAATLTGTAPRGLVLAFREHVPHESPEIELVAAFDAPGAPDARDLARWWRGEQPEPRHADEAQELVLLRRRSP